jgi:hypothetical protein
MVAWASMVKVTASFVGYLEPQGGSGVEVGTFVRLNPAFP